MAKVVLGLVSTNKYFRNKNKKKTTDLRLAEKIDYLIHLSSTKRTDEVFKHVLSIESPFSPKGTDERGPRVLRMSPSSSNKAENIICR